MPTFFIDPDGKSPISMILKQAAKVGLKKAMKSYIKSSIKKRLKNYGSKRWGKQLLNDANGALDGLDSAWWEHVIEVIPVAGDAYSAASFGKKGHKVWKRLKKLEKVADNASTIAGKAVKKINLDFSKLSGKGSDLLEGLTKKVNNISDGLKETDLVGAVKDLFGEGVRNSRGGIFNHLQEVRNNLRGLGKQLGKLDDLIKNGDLSDDVLKAAKSLRKQLQNNKDQIQSVLRKAERQANGF
jgi:vacuolar-type H+-ATPase subunit I/STV1